MSNYEKFSNNSEKNEIEEFFSFFCDKCDGHYFIGIGEKENCPQCNDKGILLNMAGASLALPCLVIGKETKILKGQRKINANESILRHIN